MSAAAAALKPIVVTVRADSDTGWRHICKEFRPFAGRPILQPHEPTVAIYGQIAPDRLGWPTYVKASNRAAILRAKASALAEARAAATAELVD